MMTQLIYIRSDIGSYIGGEIWIMCGFRYMMRRAGGSGCGGSYWATMVPRHREEIIEELEDYKAGLEAEILALEKRIKDLKAKGKEEKKE
ncbi:MAG TPA: hypothetical protein VJ643_06230 [Nitrososphaera sp.]|nr:hypothetical protein [Nitrososphaera sp.]